MGLPLINKTFVTNISGDTDVDLIISPQEQQKWLNGEPLIQDGTFDLYSQIDEKFKHKYRQNFRKLQKSAHYEQVKSIVQLYISQCVPAPKKTELSFWSITCLPSFNRSTYPRFFTLNINPM
jgi:hypothetical protein